ncbi:MAG: metallophosphoesterase [Clostridiales bacterium]|nr:metallophosphoesterase [Clostridiales bacterium]
MKITRYSAALDIPNPLRFAVIADLHARPTTELWELTRAEKPDAILMPGDIFDTRGKREDALGFIKTAAAYCPVFCSLGNHDRLICDADRKALADAGATLLDNSSVCFGGLQIGGLTSGFFSEYRTDIEKTPPPDLEWLYRFADGEKPRLLLCHHPEYYPDYIQKTTVELTVSGHAHGGQWNIFGRGVFAPGQGLFPRYTAGSYDGGRLIVSRGVTNTVKVPRLFNPTEIVVIDISPKRGAS